MEGIWFFGVTWFFWIITTFFWRRNSKIRLKVSICILLIITLSPYWIDFFEFQINLSAGLLYFFLLFEVVRLNKKTAIYLFLSSFTIMLAYDSFLLLELYDPVWVIFNRNWMIAGMLVYLCILLQQENKLRFFTLLIGTLQGEFLFSVIVKRITFTYQIGSYSFFDAIGAGLFLLAIWSIFETLTIYIEQHMNHLGRGKQKSS